MLCLHCLQVCTRRWFHFFLILHPRLGHNRSSAQPWVQCVIDFQKKGNYILHSLARRFAFEVQPSRLSGREHLKKLKGANCAFAHSGSVTLPHFADAVTRIPSENPQR